MIPQEVIDAWNKIELMKSKNELDIYRTPHKNEWGILFNYYNQHLPPGHLKLHISCMPCYEKVLKFVQSMIPERLFVGHNPKAAQDYTFCVDIVEKNGEKTFALIRDGEFNFYSNDLYEIIKELGLPVKL